jgi:hypothetical protein
MTRYTAFLLIALGTAASALAAVGPEQRTALEPVSSSSGVTVIEKNQAFPQFGPIEVEECLNEDCSLTLG